MSASRINDWRLIQRQNFTSLDSLATFLELSSEQKAMLPAKNHFPLNVPRRLAEKMTKGCVEGPLFRQFVPLMAEKVQTPHFEMHPVGDHKFLKAPKLLQKYEGRVLLVTTSACAMHCRYCFRQNFDYEVQQKGYAEEVAVIASDPSIKEVILSGGDPLSLADHTLEGLFEQLTAIPHITRIRFHTRFPIGIPERITDAFIQLLQKFSVAFWFVVHVNHPQELDSDVIAALKKLTSIGIPVLNQAVLLQGVNDSVAIQKELCESLINEGFFPYYLHQLDRVQGTHHFEVDEPLGHKIIQELMKKLPGYAIPKYVREICGEPHKTLL